MSNQFDEQMKSGSKSLNKGDASAALAHFASAVALDSLNAEALQMLGICLRMLRQLDEAEHAFKSAQTHATTELQRGKVLRDWSMVKVLRRDYPAALSLLHTSRSFLEADGTTPIHPKRRHEYYATLGFMGEVYRLMGDRIRAKRYLQQAYLALHGKDPYELNCLMRYMAAVGKPHRIILARQAWKLIEKTSNKQRNNKRRKIQIILLCISVKLVDRIVR